MKLRTLRFPNHEGLPLPAYETEGAAGMDLRAAIPEPVELRFGKPVTIPVGLGFEIPPGFEGQVRPRSSLSKRGILGHLGTIDSDYRGEVCVILQHMNPADPYWIAPGDRIAQLVIAPVAKAELETVRELAATARGAGGFGSTGRA